MKTIEVCFSPELIHLYDLTNKIVIVVDIFRATSTMITGLANQVKSFTPIADLETCRNLRNQGYVIAGERDGLPAEGFELGNSPLSYIPNAYAGKKIAMTTTNGTLAIERSTNGSAEILIGAFLNLQATADYLSNLENDILIHCAGWKGKFNLEDSLYAGALVEALAKTHIYECDSALAMSALYQGAKEDLFTFINQASHSKRLQNHQMEADIDFCLTLDHYDIVGKLVGGELVGKKFQKSRV